MMNLENAKEKKKFSNDDEVKKKFNLTKFKDEKKKNYFTSKRINKLID